MRPTPLSILAVISVLAALQGSTLAQSTDPGSQSKSVSKPLWKARVQQADRAATASSEKAESNRIDPGVLAIYLKDSQRRIKRNWYPPHHARTVTVQFRIHEHGDVSNVRILKSSGMSFADTAALQAVTNAAPFRGLPQGANAYEDFKFTFDFNIFKPNDKPMLTLINSHPKTNEPAQK